METESANFSSSVPEAPGLEPKVIDAKEGDYVVVPTRAPHTFSNETDEEARFFNTFTPVSYFSPEFIFCLLSNKE